VLQPSFQQNHHPQNGFIGSSDEVIKKTANPTSVISH